MRAKSKTHLGTSDVTEEIQTGATLGRADRRETSNDYRLMQAVISLYAWRGESPSVICRSMKNRRADWKLIHHVKIDFTE
jgi:hypothetical protein